MHRIVGEQGNPLQNRQFPLPMWSALEWAGWLNPVIPELLCQDLRFQGSLGYTVRDKPCRYCRVLQKRVSEHHLTFKRQESILKDSHPDQLIFPFYLTDSSTLQMDVAMQ